MKKLTFVLLFIATTFIFSQTASATWTSVTSETANNIVSVDFLSALTGVYTTSTDDDAHFSTDGGLTWGAGLAYVSGSSDVTITGTDPSYAAYANHSPVMLPEMKASKSTNGSAFSTTAAYGPGTLFSVFGLKAYSSTAVFINGQSAGNPGHHKVAYSSNSGSSWNTVYTEGTSTASGYGDIDCYITVDGYACMSVASSGSASNAAKCANSFACGSSWSDASIDATIDRLNDVSMADLTTAYAVGADNSLGVIYKYSGGAWALNYTSASITAFHGVSFVDADHGWVVGADGTILYTANGGTSWTSQTVAGVTTTLNSVTAYSTSKAWIGGDSGLMMYFTPDSAAPTTTASPAGGTYNSAQSVILTPDETATTYYTTDGTTPTEASSVYSSPINIAVTTTLKFFSKDGSGNSETPKTENYIIDTTAPVTTASPAGGTYTSAQTITLTATDSDTGVLATYYTTDGSTPTTASTQYSLPITISQTTTLKFYSVDNAGNSESVKTEEYIISTATPPTPFTEELDLKDVELNTTYQSDEANSDLLFYLLPKATVINNLYIKLIRNKKNYLNGFTKKNSYQGYLKLLSNIGTVKSAYPKNVNKRIDFRVSVRYSKVKLNKTNIKEKDLRLFIKDRNNNWRGPYRIYQNKVTHTLKFKIRNYLIKPPKNPVPNPDDKPTKNRPFAPTFYFRTLKKIKFVIAQKTATPAFLDHASSNNSQDLIFE